jgi:hypothetical protein
LLDDCPGARPGPVGERNGARKTAIHRNPDDRVSRTRDAVGRQGETALFQQGSPSNEHRSSLDAALRPEPGQRREVSDTQQRESAILSQRHDGSA